MKKKKFIVGAKTTGSVGEPETQLFFFLALSVLFYTNLTLGMLGNFACFLWSEEFLK